MGKNAPVSILLSDGLFFVASDGHIQKYCDDQVYRTSFEEIEETFLRACGYSVYAHADELRHGFVTTGDGCRVSFCGMHGRNGEAFSSVRWIDSIRIRIANNILSETDFIQLNGKLQSVLIVGEPASGKTTLLRSAAVNLASGAYGQYYRVCIADERNELMPQQTDVSGCLNVIRGVSKDVAMERAVRLLSPQVIVCDEIGNTFEAEKIRHYAHCGVRFIASMHGSDIDDLMRRPCFKVLLENKIFEKLILLDGCEHPGLIKSILSIQELLNADHFYRIDRNDSFAHCIV